MKILLSLLLSITLTFASALSFAFPPPGDECNLYDYTEEPSAPEGSYERYSAIDKNGDGYICLPVYKCTVCPPNAQRCNLVCNFVGPAKDNEIGSL